MPNEAQKLSDLLTEAHVQIGKRDSMIEHLKAEALAQREKIGLLHEKIGRMGLVNEQLMESLENILRTSTSTLAEKAQTVLDAAIEEKDNGYEG